MTTAAPSPADVTPVSVVMILIRQRCLGPHQLDTVQVSLLTPARRQSLLPPFIPLVLLSNYSVLRVDSCLVCPLVYLCLYEWGLLSPTSLLMVILPPSMACLPVPAGPPWLSCSFLTISLLTSSGPGLLLFSVISRPVLVVS